MVLFKKLWHKVAVVYSLIIIVIFTIFILIFKSMFLSYLEKEEYPIYIDTIKKIEFFIEPGGKVNYKDLNKFIQKNKSLKEIGILIYNDSNKLIFGKKKYHEIFQNFELKAKSNKSLIIEFKDGDVEHDYFVFSKRNKEINGMIYFIKQGDKYTKFYLKVEKFIKSFAVLLSVLFMILSAITSRWLLNPIFEILQNIKNIEIEGSSKLLKEKYSEDELKKIIQLQNNFIKKIRNFISREKKFISNASHELLTPVTVIKGYAEILRWGSEDKGVLNNALDSIEKETERMEKLMKSLMMLSKIEGTGKEVLIPLDLEKIVKEEGRRLETIYDRKIKIVSEKCLIKGENQLLKLLLGELIKNAIKYSQKDIEIELYNLKNKVALIIKDKGKGISSNYLKEMFQRFSQEDSSKVSKGFGLGLTIVKDICRLHQGKIDVKSVQGEGTEIKIIFSNEVSMDILNLR